MNRKKYQQGFSLVEIMVASLLGIIVSYAVLEMYLSQSRLYKTASTQTLIFSTENAIIHLITPIIRTTGFLGCSGTISAVSNLNAGGPPPLTSFNTNPIMLSGYNGSGASLTFTQTNPANDITATDWSPALHASLTGQVQQGNDVLIVLGAAPNTNPVGVTQINPGSSTLTIQSVSGLTLASGQLAAVSDCVKSVIFQITGISGTTITHSAGAGTLQNATNTFPVSFQVGAQFIPLQQTAFFVGQGHGEQSALMRGILNGSTWTVQPLVPGVELMKVQYGIGANGLITRYVAANAVPDWSRVYSVRLGFLIAGQLGTGSSTSRNYSVLDTTVTVPADNRMRHVFEMTIQLRNAL